MSPKQLLIMHVEDSDDQAELAPTATAKNQIACKIIRFGDAESGLDYLFGDLQELNRNDYPFPDMILLDLALPRMSGLEFLKYLRADQQTTGLPIVILTDSDKDDEIAAAYRLGAISYIVKPLELDTIILKLAEFNMSWLGTAKIPKVDCPAISRN